MTTVKQQSAVKVAVLDHEAKPVHGESLWGDAWRRLRRNRAAVLGLIIIVLNLLMAVFAPLIAPYPYDQQDRAFSNAAPEWLMSFFPQMKPRDENFRARDGEIMVKTGDQVKAGDVLVDNMSGKETQVVATFDGMVFVGGGRVILTPLQVEEFALAEGWQVEVNDAQVVAPGAVLATGSAGQTIAAPVGGTVYVLEDRLLLLPQNTGYVPLRNEYPLGTDSLGRDLLSRLVYGARVSLLVAFVGPLVSFLVGLPFGLVAGYFGGWVDNLMMRFVDLMYAFPTLLLIILFMAFFRTSLGSYEPGTFAARMGDLDRSTGGMLFIFVGVGLTSWMQLARLTRGQVLSLREREYVLAARSLGLSGTGIMWRHIFPNILGPIIVAETLTIPTYIRYEAFLSFIGLGVNPPTPSWGNMIADGAGSIASFPHQALFPAIALFFIMFAFNFLGDGLRDALDPQMRGKD